MRMFIKEKLNIFKYKTPMRVCFKTIEMSSRKEYEYDGKN